MTARSLASLLAINYRGAGGGLHLIERFRRVDDTTVHYEVR